MIPVSIVVYHKHHELLQRPLHITSMMFWPSRLPGETLVCLRQDQEQESGGHQLHDLWATTQSPMEHMSGAMMTGRVRAISRQVLSRANPSEKKRGWRDKEGRARLTVLLRTTSRSNCIGYRLEMGLQCTRMSSRLNLISVVCSICYVGVNGVFGTLFH